MLSPYCKLPFHPLNSVLWWTKIFIFMMLSLFIYFSFGTHILDFAMTSRHDTPCHEAFHLSFLLNFIISDLLFRSLDHLELTFIWYRIYLFCMSYLVSPVQFIEASIIQSFHFNWSIINNLKLYIFKVYSLMFWCTSLWNRHPQSSWVIYLIPFSFLLFLFPIKTT